MMRRLSAPSSARRIRRPARTRTDCQSACDSELPDGRASTIGTPSSGPVATVTRKQAPCPCVLSTDDIPSEHLGQSLGDDQSQAGSAVTPDGGGIALAESLEEPRQLLGTETPIPVSITGTRSWARRGLPGACCRTTRTLPCSVNLIALPMRLMRICRKRIGSVWIVPGNGHCCSTESASPLAEAVGRSMATADSTISNGEAGSKVTLKWPLSIFDMSRMSLIKLSRCSELRRMPSMNSMCWPGPAVRGACRRGATRRNPRLP